MNKSGELFFQQLFNQSMDAYSKPEKLKIKTKDFYHTFQFKGREVTLLLNMEQQNAEESKLSVTYAVRLHEDSPIEGLTKKILKGRLDKGKVLDTFITSNRFAFKLAYLKGLALVFENEIKSGETVIKGLTHGIKKDYNDVGLDSSEDYTEVTFE